MKGLIFWTVLKELQKVEENLLWILVIFYSFVHFYNFLRLLCWLSEQTENAFHPTLFSLWYARFFVLINPSNVKIASKLHREITIKSNGERIGGKLASNRGGRNLHEVVLGPVLGNFRLFRIAVSLRLFSSLFVTISWQLTLSFTFRLQWIYK